jgi:hypothetical protein
VLKHELMNVPVSLAEMNGCLRTGTKSVLADLLTIDVNCPHTIDLQDLQSCPVIDGQALVVALGRPAGAMPSGDFGQTFTTSVLQSGSLYTRIDVVFDRYRKESIKSASRKRRTKTTRPIRRVIKGNKVPLPVSWSNFLAMPENKAELSRFMSEQMIANALPDKTIVIAGGFPDEKEVQSSQPTTDMSALAVTHEEADTRYQQ